MMKQDEKIILYNADNGNITVSVRFADETHMLPFQVGAIKA
jgi:hypothetical protein